MGSREGLPLRKQALDALEKSTKMLEVAFNLLRQGNQVEAERVREEARTQRTISTLLFAEANNMELNSARYTDTSIRRIRTQSQDKTAATH